MTPSVERSRGHLTTAGVGWVRWSGRHSLPPATHPVAPALHHGGDKLRRCIMTLSGVKIILSADNGGSSAVTGTCDLDAERGTRRARRSTNV